MIEIDRLRIHQMIRLDSSINDTSDSGAVGRADDPEVVVSGFL